MYPASVKFTRANSLEEAATLLDEHGPNAQLLAGGQSLVPLMKFRLAVPDVIIDISHLSPAQPIATTEETVTIHALTTHRDVGDAPAVIDRFDVVADAIPQLADPQVRNMGTVGGAVAEADPSGDWGPLLLATDGTITTISPDGRREIPARDLYTGPFQTTLEQAEVIESVTLPVPTARSGGAYLKVKRRQGVYATATVGVHLELDDDHRCTAIEVACTAIEPTYTTPDVTDYLLGNRLTDDHLNRAANALATDLNPVTDTHGSGAFKRNLAAKLFERAARTADQRARGHDVTADPMEAA